MTEIQDASYRDTKAAGDTRLSISIRCDLRDLRNAATVLEEIYGLDFTGVSKSKLGSACIEALATMGYNQGYLDPGDMPETTKQAVRQLRLKYGITFKSNEQHRRKIAEAEEKEGLKLSQPQEKRSREEEIQRHLEGNGSEEDIEEKKQEVKEKAQKAGVLDRADEASVEEIFSAVEDDLPDPYSSLIQIGQAEKFSNQEIANILKPVVQRYERGEELPLEVFKEIEDTLRNTEPKNPTDTLR